MSQQPTNNKTNHPTNPAKQGLPRFPLFVKPGVLATRLVSASKSFMNTMGGGGSNPITGLGGGGGLFSGYRPTNTQFANIPLSRFQSTTEYLGAYGSIAAVYTCVNTIANSIAGLPTDFVDQTGKTIATLGQKEADEDSLAGLLENPNPYQDWYALKETISAHLELCGNALVLMDNMDGQGRPECLYPLNPSFIQLAVSPDKGLLGYIYQPGGSATKMYYSIDEILHFKMANPSSPLFWGQGTLQALAGNLNTEIDIMDSVNALYRNGAVIPGAFVAKESMTDTQFTQLKNQLIQDHTGSANFFKPLLLDGGLDWKAMSIGHTDLGTTEIRKLNREEIYMGFGVPVSEAGNQGRANVKNDHLTDVYWLTTIGPKVHRIEAGFKKLTKRYDPRYSLRMPLPVKVAEGEMLDNVTKVDVLTSLSNSEKRKAIKTITGDQFGWGDIPDEMPVEVADEQPLNRNIRETINPQNDPNLPGLPQPAPVTNFKPDSESAGQPNARNSKSLSLTEDAKAIIWENFNVKALDLEEEFTADLGDALAGSLGDFLTSLDLDKPDQESKGLGVSLGIQKLGEILVNKLTQAAIPHMTQAVIAGYLDATMNNLTPSTKMVTKEAKSRAAQMADTVWQHTKEQINTITESGKSRSDQAKEIRNLFDQDRAALIAGTETVSAMNYGKKSGYDATGQKSQMWITRRDMKVRHTHARADGQVSNSEFDVGGYKLKYPGDPDAPARERVRCRCTLTAVTDPGE